MVTYVCRQEVGKTNERIKELRKALGLTQQELADRIGVKRNTVATYEMGRSTPSDSAISLICREFDANETWLRTGEGEMFRKISRDDEIADFLGDVLRDENPDFRRHLIAVLARMKPEEWELLERKALELAEEMKKD